MKVLLINGSPNEYGCTYTGLSEIACTLKDNNIETEIFYLGRKPLAGCIACRKCFETGKCVFNDHVNEIIGWLDEFDGIIVGSPVHYAAASGQITSFMDRLFYAGGSKMAGKVGASIVSCRRAGSSSAFDQLNKYFTISNMPIVSSQYWNQIHGNTPDEVKQDLEGMQVMRTLGLNTAWLLKCIEAGREKGIEMPQYEKRQWTNFIH